MAAVSGVRVVSVIPLADMALKSPPGEDVETGRLSSELLAPFSLTLLRSSCQLVPVVVAEEVLELSAEEDKAGLLSSEGLDPFSLVPSLSPRRIVSFAAVEKVLEPSDSTG